MNYNEAFKTAVARVRAEGRYRVFADLLRNRGKFPRARYREAQGEVTAYGMSGKFAGAVHLQGLEFGSTRFLCSLDPRSSPCCDSGLSWRATATRSPRRSTPTAS